MDHCTRTGPPIAPSMTASASLAALRASSVRGTPTASMEAYELIQMLHILQKRIDLRRQGDAPES